MQEISTLLTLPSVLYRDVLSYLDSFEKLQFVRLNKRIKEEYLKEVRLIEIDYDQSENFFLENSLQSKCLSLIKNPFEQLKINYSGELLEAVTPSLSLLDLSTNNMDFAHFLICQLNYRIQQLTISFRKKEDNSIVLSQLTDISAATSSVKSLWLADTLLEYLPVIPSLERLKLSLCHEITIEGLHLPVYQNLKCLELLNCYQIVDVSCLDGIYDLSLYSCDNIVNISCLNHNDKIKIHDCNKIKDYSNSFQYSRFISLSIPEKVQNNIIPINPNHLLYVKKFEFISMISLPLINNNFMNLSPKISYLWSLKIKDVKSSFLLPENNHIQYISIINCPLFRSCINMGKIRHVQLIQLNLKSLEGLGIDNIHVEIVSCQSLRNFSLLRGCQHVTISNCRGFTDLIQLDGVSELHLYSTELPYKMIISQSRLLSNIKTLTIHSTMKELKKCLLFLYDRRNVEKIIISHQFSDPFINVISVDEDLKTWVFNSFIIEKLQDQRDLLLRK